MKVVRIFLLAFLIIQTGQGTLWAEANAASETAAVAPPSAPPTRSASDLEKLVAPIALYPDPLIASLLPASAYPLEIVQAARFVKDTNNIPKLDSQDWDENVKAVARFPDVIAQMDKNLSWTSDLGDAFINQPKEIMDAIQTMRTKAQGSGALKTTEQQVVVVTNTVVTNIVEQKTVVVTNQVVQIQPAQPEVIYVPQYNPTVVYSGYPPYPGYYYPPPAAVATASLVSFGVGMAWGAVLANNCDWGHGGCYHSDVDIDVDRNVNRERNVNRNSNRNSNVNANRQKWQPDQKRLQNSGSTLSSSQSREARGYSSPSQASRTASQSRAQSAGNLASSGSRSSPASANRASPSPANASRPSSSTADRASSSPGNRASSAGSSRASSGSGSVGASSRQQSAFSGGSGSQTRAASSRGAASRGGGGAARGGGGGRR